MAVINANDSFVLNDITFSVGPSNIQVVKENLSYRWHALRQSSSTKIPTGHGGCIIQLRIPIPTEDILKLHRLIVEFKQNPFAYIENKYIREEIVPHWPIHQKMAFTLLNMSIESIPGNVGLFAVNLQMQWFNYFPYTHNFLFREEWETDWIAMSNLSDEEQARIPSLLAYRGIENDRPIVWIRKSIYDYITDWGDEVNIISTSHYTSMGGLENQLEPWQGFVFDLLPLPVGMVKANAVSSPHKSKIYVRYYNELQARALRDNFGIDLRAGNWLGDKDYDWGLLSGTGGEFDDGATPLPRYAAGSGIEPSAATLPEYTSRKGIAGKIIAEMMKHDDFVLSFNTYKFVDLPPSIKKALGASTNNQIKNTVLAFKNASAAGYDLGNVDGHIITSPYGYRKHPVRHKWALHTGIDLSYVKGTPISAIADGTIIEQQDTPNSGGGRTLIIQHTDGSESTYRHLEQFVFPQAGQPVKKGHFVAYSGNSGSSTTGPHLHLEIKVDGTLVDPIEWLAVGTDGVRANRKNNPKKPELASEDVDGDGIETPVAPGNQSKFAESQGNEIKPWFSALDDMDTEITEEDKIFLGALYSLIQEGYEYYSKDTTVNGIFFKKVTIKIPGHGPFNGATDSHNTILTKISGTMRHIVAALPILGQEFPTHQHLGSTDATYNFEFVTLDHDGDRSGMGGGARLLEGARIALQQNGRSLKTIYDSWMAEGDNFITRLFGTFDHSGPHNKKLIIASTQAATIEGNPGTSALVLECEETLSYVNEALTKTNTASKSDYEAVYRKMIDKIKTIIKKAKQNPRTEADEAAYKTLKADTLIGSPIALTGLLGVGAAKIFDLGTNDFLDADISKDPVRDLNADFYELDTSKVSIPFADAAGLTPEDIRQLSDLITRMSYMLLIGQLILQEEKVGGLPQTGGDTSPIDYDLYGAEELMIPKGNKLVAWSQNNWGPGIASIVDVFNSIGIYEKAALGSVFGTSGDFAIKVHDYVSNNPYLNFAGTRSPNPTDIPELSGAALPYDIIAGFVGLFVGAAGAKKAGFEAVDLYETTLMNPIVTEVMLRAYLADLYHLTGDINLTFTGSTSEYLTTRLNSILPSNPDGSTVLNERFGLVATYLLTAKSRVESSNPSSPSSGLGIFTKEEWERNKIELIKGELIDILQPVFNQPNLMKFFGIEKEVAALLFKVIRDERDTLPDMMLPPHPYWNKTYLTPPDFYYFNYHEDGIYNVDGYDLYSSLSDRYVDGVHSFLDNWIRNGLHVDLTGNFTAGEVAEGIRDPGVSFDGYNHTAESDFPAGTNQNSFVATDVKQSDKLKFFDRTSNIFQASNFDRDVLYDPISTPDLIKRIQSIEGGAFGFGRKEGYANEREEIGRIFKNTKIHMDGKAEDTSFTHFFGAEDLKQIVRESKKDIVSQKFTMKRAFPAFRLYLIEEDQVEDMLLRYDDFYHYNAIKDITIVRSRMVAGDTAVIVLQNIAGILDGSKRNVLKDTDFLTEQTTATGELTSKGRKIEESRSIENRGTSKEETVGSIVLRPGVNIQLRCGFGNDPNNLEVMISGRIVDLAFSENSDLVEITVQSFGVELEQVTKGLDPNQPDTYNLTHKLLGALMLSPELVHFGRWEVGSQFQFGEAKDAKLDFRKYKSNEIWQKLTGIYFANTAEQVYDLYKMYTNQSFLVHFTFGNDNSLIGTALSNLYLPLLSASAVTQVGLAFTWDSITAPIRLAANTLIPRLKNEITSKKAYAMSSPQDDNIFAPNPKDYVMKATWMGQVGKQLAKNIWDGRVITGLTKATVDTARALMSQKLNISNLTYQLDNVTIWQVFHEMTLRHPGYVYAPVPYGKEFRYTMFYGLPSQRYWSKPAHPFFIERVNQTRKGLSSTMGDKSKEQGEQNSFKSTYALSDFLEVWNHNKDLKQYVAGGGTWGQARSDAASGAAPRDTTAQINAGNNVVNELREQKELLMKLGFSNMNEALLEYYTSLTLRFEPFRRYHMVTSETDIISNNINVSEYNVANAVAVKYFSDDGKEQEGIKLVKLHDRIPDEEIRMVRAPDYPNIHNELMALRYAVGHLVYEAKEMYSGSVLLVGNSRIKPWDICFLVDKYSDICGPVEVEQVVHRISFDTGFITEIKPNAVVFANEISSFPVLEGMKAFVAARTAEEDKIYSSYKGNDFFNDLMIAGFDKLETVDRSFGTDILKKRSSVYLANFAAEEISRVIGIPELVATTPLQATITSMAWLVGGFFYLNKCLDNQSIIVYPLLKNGIPMVAGIPSAQPESLWSITFGQINMFIDDVTRGTTEWISRWKLLGVETLKAFTQDATRNQQVAKSSDRISPV